MSIQHSNVGRPPHSSFWTIRSKIDGQDPSSLHLISSLHSLSLSTFFLLTSISTLLTRRRPSLLPPAVMAGLGPRRRSPGRSSGHPSPIASAARRRPRRCPGLTVIPFHRPLQPSSLSGHRPPLDLSLWSRGEHGSPTTLGP